MEALIITTCIASLGIALFILSMIAVAVFDKNKTKSKRLKRLEDEVKYLNDSEVKLKETIKKVLEDSEIKYSQEVLKVSAILFNKEGELSVELVNELGFTKVVNLSELQITKG